MNGCLRARSRSPSRAVSGNSSTSARVWDVLFMFPLAKEKNLRSGGGKKRCFLTKTPKEFDSNLQPQWKNAQLQKNLEMCRGLRARVGITSPHGTASLPFALMGDFDFLLSSALTAVTACWGQFVTRGEVALPWGAWCTHSRAGAAPSAAAAVPGGGGGLGTGLVGSQPWSSIYTPSFKPTSCRTAHSCCLTDRVEPFSDATSGTWVLLMWEVPSQNAGLHHSLSLTFVFLSFVGINSFECWSNTSRQHLVLHTPCHTLQKKKEAVAETRSVLSSPKSESCISRPESLLSNCLVVRMWRGWCSAGRWTHRLDSRIHIQLSAEHTSRYSYRLVQPC